MQDGVWWFTVRWRPYTPIPHKFPRDVVEYSINLWETDLGLFEAVSAEEELAFRKSKSETWTVSQLPPLPQLAGGWQARRRVRVHPNQLGLFLPNDFE